MSTDGKDILSPDLPVADGQLGLLDLSSPETSQNGQSAPFPTEMVKSAPPPSRDDYVSTHKTAGKKKRQPRIGRYAPPKEERRFDTTALHYDVKGGMISHADYLAHCEKYDYAYRSIRRGDKILDVGCGTDQPLAKAITKAMSTATALINHGGGYVGVDLNRISRRAGYSWCTIIDELDATDSAQWSRIKPRSASANQWAFGEFTLAICLEVIEHMGVDDGRRLLATIFNALEPGGRLILSTPVFNGQAARNHIHEYEIPELQALIEEAGFIVDRRMGTFTSEPVIKRWLKANHPDWLEIYMAAREFHSSGYMSGLFAPMVPDESRNNIWDCRKP